MVATQLAPAEKWGSGKNQSWVLSGDVSSRECGKSRPGTSNFDSRHEVVESESRQQLNFSSQLNLDRGGNVTENDKNETEMTTQSDVFIAWLGGSPNHFQHETLREIGVATCRKNMKKQSFLLRFEHFQGTQKMALGLPK